MTKIKIFCLPYAGGSSIVFNKWKNHLNNNFELIPIELAGRGHRIQEPLYASRREAVLDAYDQIEKRLNDDQYILFGHSMGSLIAYELIQIIQQNEEFPMPLHAFFSGSSAPHLRDKNKKYHLLGEEEFKSEVLELGGTPPEFFEHPELMEVFLPILKNDFKLAETEIHNKINALNIDITVLLGRKDDFTSEQCEEWSKHTNTNCDIRYFDGGHFFINEETAGIVELIQNVVESKLSVAGY